jgi:hypothetical protein
LACASAARPLPQALAAFRAALAGRLPPPPAAVSAASTDTANASGVNGLHGAHKLLRLQVYADACVLSPAAAIVATPAAAASAFVRVSDTDCTSLAWWLSFDRPLSDPAAADAGEGPLELVMELIARLEEEEEEEEEEEAEKQEAPQAGDAGGGAKNERPPSTEVLLRRAAAAGLVEKG